MPNISFMDSMIFLPKKFGDIPFSNIPPTNTTSSSSTIRTTSTTSILITNRRSTDLHPCIYSRLWLFQIRTAASGTEAESIRLFRTSLSFRVQRNIVPLLRKDVLKTQAATADPFSKTAIAHSFSVLSRFDFCKIFHKGNKVLLSLGSTQF